MTSSGGSSISHWRLFSFLRNYVSKLSPSTVEKINKDIKSILSLPKNYDTKPKDVVAYSKIETPDSPKKENTNQSYHDVKKALSSLNTYMPQLPQVLTRSNQGSDDTKKESLPKWVNKKKDIVSRGSIDARTRHLIRGLNNNLSECTTLRRIEDIFNHLKEYPETRGVAIKCSGISRLLKILHSSNDSSTQEGARQTLAILGYSAPVSSHGIKILSIDGGGTRGLVAIDMLRHLEEKTKCPVHELFDLVCGVSTGAILAVLIGVHRLSLDAIERLYKEISSLIFSQTTIKGTASLVWNNSYYDSDVWTEILKIHMGETPMIETANKEETKKLCLVSTQANSNWVKAFLFRNYNFPYRAASHFNGCSSARLWEGVRASAAAPGYFSEFKLNDLILLDGGVMVNNPAAIAIHEARNIWPDTPLQSVVSLGTGRYEPLIIEGDKSINWASRLRTIINSATDTEGVHTTLHDLLPGNVYFRLNPYLSEEITLDETREDKLNCLKKDTSLYVRKNESKLDEAVESLLRPKSLMDKTKDYVTLQKQMYEL